MPCYPKGYREVHIVKEVQKLRLTLSYSSFSLFFLRCLKTRSSRTPNITTRIMAANTPIISISLEVIAFSTPSIRSRKIVITSPLSVIREGFQGEHFGKTQKTWGIFPKLSEKPPLPFHNEVVNCTRNAFMNF